MSCGDGRFDLGGRTQVERGHSERRPYRYDDESRVARNRLFRGIDQSEAGQGVQQDEFGRAHLAP